MIGERLAGAEIFHREIELAESSVVVAIGQKISVSADRKGLHRHEGLALRQFVDIEEDFFVGVGADLFAAADGVLLAGFGADVIEEVALFVRDLDIRFFYPAEHLVVELFLEGFRGLHHRVGVGVLGFEVGADLGIGFLAQPKIVIDQLVAVDLGDVGDLFRDRRGWEVVGWGEDEHRDGHEGEQVIEGHR
jgi:hypothetical protein